MNLAQLTERMSGWLSAEYQAIIFELGSSPVGYALYRREPDFIYIRQLFVLADHRRQGLGRQAIDWMHQNAWPAKSRLRIDVLVGNTTAHAFWKSVGFRDYCITMEFE